MIEESADNRRNFRKLRLAIEASYGKLSLLMALSDNWKHRNELIEQYETELTGKGTHCYRVKVDQQQYSLKQCLLDLAQQEPELGNGNAVVTVLGADELLGVRLRQDEKSSQEKLFFSLQWTREALRQFQVPVIMWLTPRIAGQLAQAAPDFWSWRGGVFEFSKPLALTLGDKPVTKHFEDTENRSEGSNANPEEIAKQIAELEAQDPDSPLLASLYMDLGTAYKTAVRYADAVRAYEQAMKLRESQLGAEHVDMAVSLNELAMLHKSMGRYSEAESLFVRSLKIIESKLGANYPNMAVSLNNVAELYRSMGRYGEAESLFVRALEIRESQLGADHPDKAMSLNNLATLYDSMDRYSEAEPLYLRAIQIDEKTLPLDHPQGVELDENNFRGLLKKAITAGKTDELSDHPLTQTMLNELQQESS